MRTSVRANGGGGLRVRATQTTDGERLDMRILPNPLERSRARLLQALEPGEDVRCDDYADGWVLIGSERRVRPTSGRIMLTDRRVLWLENRWTLFGWWGPVEREPLALTLREIRRCSLKGEAITLQGERTGFHLEQIGRLRHFFFAGDRKTARCWVLEIERLRTQP